MTLWNKGNSTMEAATMQPASESKNRNQKEPNVGNICLYPNNPSTIMVQTL
jgi:hypothetical protein